MAAPSQWSTGLCDCSEDSSSCSLTYCCPCIFFGRIAEIVGKGNTCWEGNLGSQNRGVVMPPVGPSEMKR
ncbi:hypothetical protein L1987_57499 [Smallanthus sonchifolius]|uniref:Uncharacterized protein n=1 Tax=Smallanthus sonchifolius TaxID=185202 RepID=A0ACB9DCT3_9ASTR|nr:hypothetical protein L1987_57499 [Smallanthus sonchifolius]